MGGLVKPGYPGRAPLLGTLKKKGYIWIGCSSVVILLLVVALIVSAQIKSNLREKVVQSVADFNENSTLLASITEIQIELFPTPIARLIGIEARKSATAAPYLVFDRIGIVADKPTRETLKSLERVKGGETAWKEVQGSVKCDLGTIHINDMYGIADARVILKDWVISAAVDFPRVCALTPEPGDFVMPIKDGRIQIDDLRFRSPEYGSIVLNGFVALDGSCDLVVTIVDIENLVRSFAKRIAHNQSISVELRPHVARIDFIAARNSIRSQMKRILKEALKKSVP